jgi:multiple sugar transport system permease protein
MAQQAVIESPAGRSAQEQGRRRWRMTPGRRETLWGYAFISPWLIGFALFTAGPLIAAFVLSLTDFNLTEPDQIRFVGLDNYAQLLRDPLVWQGLIVTARFALIAIPSTMFASLGLAVLVNSPRLRGRRAFRTLFYMPIQIPLVAATLVWGGFLNTETGWMNGLLGWIGLPQPDWINNDVWIYGTLTLIGLWGIGNFMLINITGLQNVPTELYEAARIDGAGAWKSFRHITIPLLSPILLYNLVIIMITTVQYFVVPYVLTNGRGDPHNATLFINLVLFRDAFVNFRMGYAAAIGWVLFAIVLAFTVTAFALARSRVYYAGENR